MITADFNNETDNNTNTLLESVNHPEAKEVAEILAELRKYRDGYKYGSKERTEYNGVCDRLDCLVSHLIYGF